jgi:hypothetical protein
MQKIIYKLIREFTKGVDTYTHNGSTWLMFTDTKQWVIELTKDRTLWYNYTFFKGMFSYCSIEVVDNQHYITQWVEDNIINGSKNTPSPSQTPSCNLVEVLENGVKETELKTGPRNLEQFGQGYSLWKTETVINEGVKEIKRDSSPNPMGKVSEVIDNGVKENL